jgi:hypothetical protein
MMIGLFCCDEGRLGVDPQGEWILGWVCNH